MAENEELERIWGYYKHADDLQHRRHQLFVTLQAVLIAGFVTSSPTRPALALIFALAGISYAILSGALAGTVQRGMDSLSGKLRERDPTYRRYLEDVRPVRGLLSGRWVLNLYLPALAGIIWVVLVATEQQGGIQMNDARFWTAVAAVAASLSALFAALYTWLTFRLVRGQSEPNVIIYVRHDESRRSVLQIVIENIGRGLATDLRFKPSREIPQKAWGFSETDVKPVQPMTEGPLVHGIPSLAPGDSRKISWGQYFGLKKALGDQPITVICEYKHGRRQMPAVTAMLEIDSFTGTDALESEAARVTNELARIADAMEKSSAQ